MGKKSPIFTSFHKNKSSATTSLCTRFQQALCTTPYVVTIDSWSPYNCRKIHFLTRFPTNIKL